jgi:phage gp37-like protein
MSIETVRTAIVDMIDAEISALKTCEAHPGRFDLTELKRVAANAPAVFVAALATGQQENIGGDTWAPVSFAAFIVTKDQPGKTRDSLALDIVNALLVLADSNDWDSEDVVEDPVNLRSQNLYSSSIDKNGIAMWAITWQQKIKLGNVTDVAALDDFLRANGTAENDNGDTLIETTVNLEDV